MSTLKIELVLSEGDTQATELAINLIKDFGHINNSDKETPAPIAEKPKRAIRKKKVVETPKEETPKEETPKEETPKEETPKEETPKEEIKIEDVRKLLAEKVKTHREEIKAKLTELGSKNVTNLDEGKYREMYDFLNDL